MKLEPIRLLGVIAALWAIAPGSVLAESRLRLAWNECSSSPGVAKNLDFACDDSLAGPFVLVGSFVAPAGVQQWTGQEAYVDLQSAAPVLPAWWHFEAGGCREGSMVPSPNLTGYAACAHYRDTLWIGGYDWQPGRAWHTMSSTAALLSQVWAIPPARAGGLTPGRENYAFRVVIDAAHTVPGRGTVGACGGCGFPACVYFEGLYVTQPVGMGDHDLRGPGGPDEIVTWQDPGASCQAVPVRRATWGGVKSLYR